MKKIKLFIFKKSDSFLSLLVDLAHYQGDDQIIMISPSRDNLLCWWSLIAGDELSSESKLETEGYLRINQLYLFYWKRSSLCRLEEIVQLKKKGDKNLLIVDNLDYFFSLSESYFDWILFSHVMVDLFSDILLFSFKNEEEREDSFYLEKMGTMRSIEMSQFEMVSFNKGKERAKNEISLFWKGAIHSLIAFEKFKGSQIFCFSRDKNELRALADYFKISVGTDNLEDILLSHSFARIRKEKLKERSVLMIRMRDFVPPITILGHSFHQIIILNSSLREKIKIQNWPDLFPSALYFTQKKIFDLLFFYR